MQIFDDNQVYMAGMLRADYLVDAVKFGVENAYGDSYFEIRDRLEQSREEALTSAAKMLARTVSPEIQASRRRQRPDAILEKIKLSEYPSQMMSATGRMIRARNFEAAKTSLWAIYKAGDLNAISTSTYTMTTSQITDLIGGKIPHRLS